MDILLQINNVDLSLILFNLLFSRLLSKNIKVTIYKSIILPVVLYGCETWSLTLREEYRLRVFENRVLRRLFGPKRDEVTGGCHQKELPSRFYIVNRWEDQEENGQMALCLKTE
jgi:hypothetical protein